VHAPADLLKKATMLYQAWTKFVPVDVYLPGCPPTPQSLMHGLMTLQKIIAGESIRTVRWYQKEPSVPVPIPVLGPDLITCGEQKISRRQVKIYHKAKLKRPPKEAQHE